MKSEVCGYSQISNIAATIPQTHVKLFLLKVGLRLVLGWARVCDRSIFYKVYNAHEEVLEDSK